MGVRKFWKCPICGEIMKPKKIETGLHINLFSSRSQEEKKAILKKRSDLHNRTDKELVERRAALDRGEKVD